MSTQDKSHIGPEDYPDTTDVPVAELLVGCACITADGRRIGVVEDVYIDRDDAYIRYVAVAEEGADRVHVLPIDEVSPGGPGEVRAPYTAGELRGAPTIGRDDDVTPEREEAVYGHYGRTGYWEDVRARQRTPAATPEIARAEGERGDDLDARQTAPAPTPEIAVAEAETEVAAGHDTRAVRVRRWSA